MQINILHVLLLLQFSRTLSDVSNTNTVKPTQSKHRLYPCGSSQMLDETTDNVRVVNVANIENVHLTAAKSQHLVKVKDKSKSKSKVRVTKKKNSGNHSEPGQRSSLKVPPAKFQPSGETQAVRRKVCGNVAMTQVEKADRDLAKEMARRFGLLAYSEMVNSETTHLVCGQTKRTINLLKALLRGCWILTKVNFH